MDYVKCRVSCWSHVQVAIPHVALLCEKWIYKKKWVYKRGLKGTTHIFSPAITASVHLAIRECLCLFIRKRMSHGCGYEQADLLKSEKLSPHHMNAKFGPSSLGRKDCSDHLLLAGNVCDPKKGVPCSAEALREPGTHSGTREAMVRLVTKF